MSENMLSSSNEQIDIDKIISGSPFNLSSRNQIPDVFYTENLRDAITFILYHNTNQRNNETLSVQQEDIFHIIEQLHVYPKKMFSCLRNHFEKQFDIDLRIIAFNNEKYSLTNVSGDNKKNSAFLSFDKDNKVSGPLYITNANGTIQTVFSSDNNDIVLDVCIYVAFLNDKNLATNTHHIPAEPPTSCAQELIENTPSTNQLNSSNSVQLDDKTQSRIVLDQALQQIFRLIDGLLINPQILCEVLQPFVSCMSSHEHLSLQDTIMASKYGIGCLSQIVQLSEQLISASQNAQVNTTQSMVSDNINNQTIEIIIQPELNPSSSNTEIQLNSSLPNTISAITVDTDNVSDEMSVGATNNYPSPALEKSLKSPCRPRTLKEFSETHSSPVKCVRSKQRAPLSITVPSADKVQLYLGIKVLNVQNQTHSSKIIVPNQTKAQDDALININDLKCLTFTECDQDDKFDCNTRELYSKISFKERQHRQKKIRIHMISLYQRGKINRKVVQTQDLKKCKLAFWFSVYENKKYKRVSEVSYSNVMEEYKKNSKTKKKTPV